MSPKTQAALAAALAAVGLAAAAAMGCSKSSDSATEAPEAVPVTVVAEPDTPPPPTFTAIDQSLKGGSFDDAAALLLEMRTSGRSFTPEEAAEYRRRLNEAYTAALEAADKGDPRAKAAIQMIRASGQ